MMNWKELEGKKVFMRLKTGRFYTGKVISYDNNFLKIIDKYGQTVYVALEEVNFIEEVR